MKANVRDLALRHASEILYVMRVRDDVLQSQVEFITDNVESVIGYGQKELMKTPGLWYSLIHPEDLSFVKDSLSQICQTKKFSSPPDSEIPGKNSRITLTYRISRRITSADNSIQENHRLIEDTISAESEGKMVRLFGSARDITNDKNMWTSSGSESHRENEKSFYSIFENAPVGVYRTTPDGRVLLANPMMVKLLGFSSFEELSHYDLEEEGHYLSDYPRSKFRELVEEKGYILGLETRKTRKDGTPFWVRENSRVVYDENHKVLYYEGTFEDISERKSAEEALHKSEEMLRDITESVPDIIYSVDGQNGEFTYLSPSFKKVLGYTMEDIQKAGGRRAFIEQVLQAGNAPNGDELFEQMRNGRIKEFPTFELWWRCKDGSMVCLEDHWIPVFDENGFVGTHGILRDVTNHRRAQEALRESEEKFRMVFENAYDGINIVEESEDPTRRRLVDCNERFAQLAGRSREELLRIGYVYPLTKPLTQEIPHDQIDSVKEGSAFRGTASWIRPDGKYNVYEYTGVPTSIQGKRYTVGFDRDVTERVIAEQALRKSEEMFRDITESVPDIIYSVDGETEEFTYLSPAFEKVLGYTMEDVRKMGGRRAFFDQVIQPVDLPNGFEVFDKMRSREIKEPPIYESWWRCKDGTMVCLEDRSIPVFEGDRFAGTRGVLRNITDQKHAEEALHESEQKFRMLFENAYDGISLIEENPDPNLRRLVDCNERYAELAGRSKEELLSIGYVHTLSKLLTNEMPHDNIGSVTEGSAFRGTFSWNRPDGKDNIIEYIGVPIFIKGKNYAVGIDRDVTEHITAEEALRKSEETLAIVTNSVDDIIYSVDVETGEFSYLSPAFERLLGYSQSDITEMGGRWAFLSNVIQNNPSDHDPIVSELRQHKYDEINVYYGWWRCKDGSLSYIEDKSAATYDGDRLVRVDGVLRDTTERKKAEEALRKSEEMLAIVTNSVDDIIYSIDGGTGEFTYISPAFERLLGYSRSDITEMGGRWPFLSKIVQNNAANHDPVVNEMQKDKHDKVYCTYNWWRCKNGSLLYIEDKSTTTYDSDHLVRVDGVLRDTTERKKVEDALHKSEETLKQITDSIDDIIYSVDGQTAEFTYLSPGFERKLGYSLSDIEEMGGRWAFIQRIVEKYQDTPPELADLQTEKNIENPIHENWWRCHDGTMVYIQDRWKPFYENGKLIRVDGVLRDTTASKKAEDAIQHERILLRTLIDNLPFAVYVKDTSFRKVIANPVDVSLCGCTSEEEVLGKTDFELYPKELADQSFLVDQKVIVDGTPVFSKEETFVDPNGKERCRLTSKIPLKNSKGDIIGLVGVGVDITDQKELDSALRQSEAELRALFDSMRDIILVLERDGKFLNVLSNDDSMLIKPASEVKGRTMHEIFPKEQADFFVSMINKTLETKQPQNFEYAIEIGGEGRWRHATATGLTENSVLWVARDITELKLKQKEITESEKKYRDLVENSLVGVFKMNLSGRMTYANQAMAEMLEYLSPQELMPINSLDTFVSADEREGLVSELRKNGKTEKNREIKLVTKSGKVKNILISASLDGTVVSAVVKDITDLRMLEQEFLQTQKLEGLGNIAAGIAHDFNNILGVILGYSDLLGQSKYEQPKFDRGIRAITKAADRGRSLVKQLLTFARKTATTFESMIVNDIAIEIERLLMETFPKTIEVHTELQKNLPAILADSTQVHQVLLNLCVNARDAMPKGGQLSILTRTVKGKTLSARHPNALSSDYVELQVSDTGIGMTKDILKRIFEPFFTTKGVGKGTGLGLAVVYGIVESHGGFIDVFSEPDKGTTFNVYFPVTQQTADRPGLKGEPSGNMGDGSGTVLIIEDEEMLRDLLRTILESNGYNVISARDGEDGVQMFWQNRNNVALVISDLGLPKLSGEEVVSSIRQMDPKAKLIIASGFIYPEVKTGLTEIGVISFILKPYKTNEVLQIIHDAIARK